MTIKFLQFSKFSNNLGIRSESSHYETTDHSYTQIIDIQSIRREFEIDIQVYCIIVISIGKVADSWFLSSCWLDST